MASYRTLSQIFTRPVIDTMAAEGDGRVAQVVIEQAGLQLEGSLARRFCSARRLLEQHYRCEYVYKAAIVDRVVYGRHRPTTASIQAELMVGRSIVDLAVFNGTSTAYEIKTELDTDRRLSTQTDDYLSVFDKVFVVTHPDLASNYMSGADERVGIISLCERGRLRIVRDATSDLSRLRSDALFRTLRRDEYVQIIEEVFGQQEPLPNGVIFAYCQHLFNQLPPSSAHSYFVGAMRRRTTNHLTVDFASALPPSLRLFGLSMRFSGKQRGRLLSAFAA